MTKRLLLSPLLLASLATVTWMPAVAAEDGHVVISWSHSSPDTAYWQRYGPWLERRPFDGVVFELDPRDATWLDPGYWQQQARWIRAKHLPDAASPLELPRDTGSLGWSGGGGLTSSSLTGPWNPSSKYTDETLSPALADLKGAKPKKFTHNFIVASVQGPTTDWFSDEDFAHRYHNFTLLARFAKQAGCRGIFFDDEDDSEGIVWHYDDLRRLDAVGGRSFDEVRQKARERGRSFATALCAEFPDLVFWTRHGYSTAAHLIELGLPEHARDLRTAFYDGVLEGSSDQMVFIDGGELAQGFHTREQFAHGRQTILEEPVRLALTQVPELHREKVRCGFGLWVDYLGNINPNNLEESYFSPGRFQRALHWALEVGDGYVWVYGERWTWWLEGPDDRAPVDTYTEIYGLPLAYWTALESGRTSPGTDTSQVHGSTTGLASQGRHNCIDAEQLPPFLENTENPQQPFVEDWTFKLDDWGHALDDPDTFKPIDVNKPWGEQGFTAEDTIGWYRLEFTLEARLKDRILHLHFPDVDGSIWLWSLSGPRPQILAHRYIGVETKSRRQPFVLTHPQFASHFFPPGKPVTMVVKVQRHSDTGGILAPVQVKATKKE